MTQQDFLKALWDSKPDKIETWDWEQLKERLRQHTFVFGEYTFPGSTDQERMRREAMFRT